MTYAPVHSRSYALVGRKGASVTFTRVTQTYTEATDVLVPVSTSITGNAVRDDGKGKGIPAGGLTEAKGTTLFFVPSTYGDSPSPGDTCSWGSVTYTVTEVQDVAPDGTAIGSYVVLA